MKWSLVVSVGLVGCSTDVGAARGDLDQVDFEITGRGDPGEHCFISCAPDHPLMTGTVETIGVATRLTTFMHGRSSDERVLTVEDDVGTCCNHACSRGDTYDQCLAEGKEASYYTSFNITALANGSAYLELYTPSNELFDRLALVVHDAHTVELEVHDYSHNTFDASTPDTLELAGQHVRIRAVARDRAGDWLFASRGLAMEIRDPNLATFNGKAATIDADHAEVWPLARGTDTLVLLAGDANSEYPIVSR